MRSSEKLENLAEVIRAIEPSLELKLAHCRNNPPDPNKQPITSSVVAAYVSRLELELATIRRGARGLEDQFHERPKLTEEIIEIESWILRRKPGVARPQISERDAEVKGDWFVRKMGYSYSDTTRRIAALRQLLCGKGAPNKRPETLKMYDAKTRNQSSYREVAVRLPH